MFNTISRINSTYAAMIVGGAFALAMGLMIWVEIAPLLQQVK